MKTIDNVNEVLKDDLKSEIKEGSKLSIAAACFSIYAFQELTLMVGDITPEHDCKLQELFDVIKDKIGQAINSIIDVKEESDIDSFLTGEQVSFATTEIKGLDDFELICFLVVKDSEELKNKKPFKLVVAGSRDFNDYNLLSTTLDEVVAELKADYNITIVSGTANGADKFGEKYAEKHGLKIERHPANWGRFGRGAGPIRNAEMVKESNGVIVFWNGESAGAKNIIECAKAEGNLVRVVEY